MADFTPKLIDTHGRNKTAQDIQDDIFKKMSADRKLELGAALWKFAKQLSGNNFNYATRINRSPKITRHSRKYS